MEPITIDLRRVNDYTLKRLTAGIPAVLEEAAEDLACLKRTQKKRRKVTLPDGRAWHDLIVELASRIRVGGLVTLRTPTECCAFTTLASEAQHEYDPESLFDFIDAIPDGRILPDCVAPLCAFADFDEWDYDGDDEVIDPNECYCYAEASSEVRPLIRHPLRVWTVTVTMEAEIDRSFHPCDPDKCPLEVTLRKRVTFKSIIGRTEHQAEHRALDLFETKHKVMEGASYGADARLVGPGLLGAEPAPDPEGVCGREAVYRWYERHSRPWVCVCGSTHEDSP